MHPRILSGLLLAAGAVLAAGAAQARPAPCSDAWYQMVEDRVRSGDGQGHGPDIGSEEWKSVIEFKLGLRGRAGVPPLGSPAWCRFIDARVAARPQPLRGPSFSCAKVRPGSAEAMVCGDAGLSALDRKLAATYAAARGKAAHERSPMLQAEQRGWIKSRNDCWKSEDRRACVQDAYVRRIAELQARYRLVPGTGPVTYVCDGNPADEVVATYFQTDPPTLIATRGDGQSLMFLQPSGSGARYQGRNESLWEHQGEALVTWGAGAPEMRCRLR